MDSIEEINKKRFDFLKKLYELSGGNEHKLFNMWEIGDQLGFDHDLTISIAQYLKGEGLLGFRALGGIISITHYGTKEVEENLLKHVQIIEQVPLKDQPIFETNLSSENNGNIITQFLSKIQTIDIWKYYEIRACFKDIMKLTDGKLPFCALNC